MFDCEELLKETDTIKIPISATKHWMDGGIYYLHEHRRRRRLTKFANPNMTFVSNDPLWWPAIDAFRLISYFVVASSTAVVYDWAFTFGQEIELIWSQRWSIMTFLYLGVRYLGLLYSVVNILWNLPLPTTDVGCTILYFIQTWMPVVVNAMLGVIMMNRIHAMYQQSKTMLIFLIVVFLATTIATGVMTAVVTSPISGVELILSGTHICLFVGDLPLILETWIPTIAWEILVLFLAVWIIIKHFRELRQSSTGSTMKDCFAILIKGHVMYFVTFAAISSSKLTSAYCLQR